jgi:polyhydroxyalkanoate synthase subunit PhaC
VTEQQIVPPDVENFFDKYSRGMRIVVEGAQADTGQTPKATVWTKNKAKLYRYEPEKEKKYPVPILIVYALINRPYVLDLIPGNSLIEYLVGEGFDVYLLDWGIPGDEDEDMSFEQWQRELTMIAEGFRVRNEHDDLQVPEETWQKFQKYFHSLWD